jgi:Fic family protein
MPTKEQLMAELQDIENEFREIVSSESGETFFSKMDDFESALEQRQIVMTDRRDEMVLDEYRLRQMRILEPADVDREMHRQNLIAWCKAELANRNNNKLKYEKTTSTESTKVWGYTRDNIHYLQYEMECFDLNFDKVMGFYMPIENYIKTTNASDGRLLLKLVETIDESN